MSKQLQDQEPPPSSGKFVEGGALLLILTALGVGAVVGVKKWNQHREFESRHTELGKGPIVRGARIEQGGGERTYVLQGDALPYLSTTLYAKLSGFLRQINVDKGSAVSADQVIAVIESPETDQDFQALKADADNKLRNSKRAESLGKQQLLSDRDVEQAQADARMAEAKLKSTGALKAYQVVKAPFAGVITQRFADPGALVQNASNSTSALPLVTVAQVDRLRVTIYLDQTLASQVAVGALVTVRAAERPDLIREAHISRVNGGLDPRTRTLLAEVDLDNHDRAFLAGGSVQVELKVKAGTRLEIPAEAITLKNGRPFAVVLGVDNKVHLAPLTLGDEERQRVRVLGGVKEGDTVILNPGLELQEGTRVRVVN
jgi:RND family efflux transporter MFP subunit